MGGFARWRWLVWKSGRRRERKVRVQSGRDGIFAKTRATLAATGVHKGPRRQWERGASETSEWSLSIPKPSLQRLRGQERDGKVAAGKRVVVAVQGGIRNYALAYAAHHGFRALWEIRLRKLGQFAFERTRQTKGQPASLSRAGSRRSVCPLRILRAISAVPPQFPLPAAIAVCRPAPIRIGRCGRHTSTQHHRIPQHPRHFTPISPTTPLSSLHSADCDLACLRAGDATSLWSFPSLLGAAALASPARAADLRASVLRRRFAPVREAQLYILTSSLSSQ